MAGGEEWKSADTAPRDGTWIIGLYVDHCRVIRWREGVSTGRYRAKGERIWFWSDGYFRPGEPVAWAPLPPRDIAVADLHPAPPKKPAPSAVQIKRIITVEQKPQRRIVAEKPSRRTLVDLGRRSFCEQCDRTVTVADAEKCASPFCKHAARAA
jgi:hypothetical protein